MSKKILLVYGSDTGVTEDISEQIVKKWGDDEIDLMSVADIQTEDFANHQYIILGLSTWYYGELQSDWEGYFDDFQEIDFSGKTVALFGLGDQDGYGDYFVDGVGILAEVVLKNGGEVVGKWPIAGYEFEASKAQEDDEHFYGLALDEDNQPDETEERLDGWIPLVKEAFV